MKEIKIKNFKKIGPSYHVYLGNGTDNSFASKRDALYFIASTNNFLNDKLHELHCSYVDIWNCYQENWFYFDNTRQTCKNDLMTAERDCRRNLDAIRDLFQIAVDRAGWVNGNYFSFINLLKVTDNLEDTIKVLAKIYGKHSNTNAIYKMDVLIKRVLSARNELVNYANRATTKIFKIPTHISEKESYTPEIELRVA